MREDHGGSWFSRWEDQLPSPDELVSLSQCLITPDLALAFDIPITNNSNTTPSPSSLPPSSASPVADHHRQPDSVDGGSGDEPARTLKRPRLVWTPQLHKRFVDAVAHLGIKNAVPKTIMQLMGVDGLTRENVASHLQKYRLYLKRMQGGGGGASPSSAGASGIGHISAADHQLFASAPVPHHFLLGPGGGPPSEPPFSHPSAAAAAAATMQQYYNHHHHHHHHQQQQQFYHQRHIEQFGSPPPNGFGGGLMLQRMMGNGHYASSGTSAVGLYGTYHEDMESEVGRERRGGGEMKVLTLFPTGDD